MSKRCPTSSIIRNQFHAYCRYCLHVFYTNFSCFLLEVEVFSPFFSYIFLTIHWMFSSWPLKHAVFEWIWILYHFTQFVGKFRLSPLKHARWCRVSAGATPPTWDHRTVRTAVVTSSIFSSWMSQKDNGGNQRSLKTSSKKFMENSEILCMRKTW